MDYHRLLHNKVFCEGVKYSTGKGREKVIPLVTFFIFVMISLDKIQDKLQQHKSELKQRFGIVSIGIFGSFVRGEMNESSDLDLLVEIDKDSQVGLLKFIEAENFLSDLFGVKVDLVERSVLKPRIGKHILQEVVYS